MCEICVKKDTTRWNEAIILIIRIVSLNVLEYRNTKKNGASKSIVPKTKIIPQVYYMNKKIELSIVLPCLNEEKAISICLNQILEVISKNKISSEIIIVDNESKDSSVSIIEKFIDDHKNDCKDKPESATCSIHLLHEPIRGYGSAYQRGLSSAKGKYIFMADLDGTYDFYDIPRFIDSLKTGNDLAVGNRFMKNINTGTRNLGSMPWHHKYIGNPFLSGIVRLFFGVKIKDIHCGVRAIKRESLKKLHLTARGMEFASEMIIKATKAKLNVREIPVPYNERFGSSKLNSWRDGWRHLRFILIYSPMVIFLIPGIVMLLIGIISTIFVSIKNPLFLSAGSTIIGYQLIYFAFFAKIYAITHLGEKNSLFEKLFKYITLEKAGILGIVMLLLGILSVIKYPVLGLTLLVLSVQTISSAFMLSILAIKEK